MIVVIIILLIVIFFSAEKCTEHEHLHLRLQYPMNQAILHRLWHPDSTISTMLFGVKNPNCRSNPPLPLFHFCVWRWCGRGWLGWRLLRICRTLNLLHLSQIRVEIFVPSKEQSEMLVYFTMVWSNHSAILRICLVVHLPLVSLSQRSCHWPIQRSLHLSFFFSL